MPKVSSKDATIDTATHPYPSRQRWLYLFEDRFGEHAFAGYPLGKVLDAIQLQSSGRVVLNETRAFEKARESDHNNATVYNGFRVSRVPAASVDWCRLPDKCHIVTPSPPASRKRIMQRDDEGDDKAGTAQQVA